MNGSGIKRFKLKKKNEFTKGKIFFESDLLSREYDLEILKNTTPSFGCDIITISLASML